MALEWVYELWESGTFVALGYFEGKPFQEEWDDSKVKRGGSAGFLGPQIFSPDPDTTAGGPRVKYARCPLKQHGGQRG